MYQEFFLGQAGSEYRRLSIDTSVFSTVAQLSFPAATRIYSSEYGELASLDKIQSHPGPLELRVNPDGPVKTPAGPRPLPVVGNHYEVYPDALGNYDRLFARYGPMFKTTNMGTTIYHTNDPEIARFVLREGAFFTKTTSDPAHPLFYMQEQTALFTCDSASPAYPLAHKFVPPALSPRAVAHHTPLVQAAARSIFPVLDALDADQRAFNVYQYMFKMGGQVIWRVVAGQDVAHFAAVDTPPTHAIRLFGEYLALMKKMSLRPAWFGRLPFGDPARLRKVREDLFATVEQAMDAAVTPGAGTLPLRDPLSQQRAACVADFLARARDEKGEALPRDVLLGNVTVLLGAGFVTSASLLSWALYSLVAYPGNQERLLQEIADHGGCAGDGEGESRPWSYDEVHSLKFLDAFVKETQRLHSPSFQTARNAKTDVVLPGGYLVPQGAVVIACFPSMHKNPRFWDNPARFEPERWMADGVAAEAARKGLYTPFAAGARGCVGFNLALLQVKMVLIELVWRYRFEDASPEPVVYDPEFLVTRPLNFYASAVRRTKWPEKSKV
ncbi:Cytochrome p450 [Lasiodiplodia theobromae]|uniref:Cytochrome p450 n=1 Tax=Lasiodiplodia theobromae TaxID=45133 RepID=UPI0015C2ED69|nr:Cytochrome p450 [Lasiodiplodia theobromae]KAF4545820.1 Cytochrome p450 [Lasiodiplodia theobromae]